jgi:hypothetical protein
MSKGKRAPSRKRAGQELIEDQTYVGKGGWHTRVGEVIYVLRTIRGHWMAYADQLERLVQGNTNHPLDDEQLQLERIQLVLSSVFNHRKADLTKWQVAQLKTSLHWAIMTTSQRLRAIPVQARREKKAAHGVEKWLAKFAPGTVSTPTVWHHGERAYSTDGHNPVVVAVQQHAVLTAFMNARAALDTKALEQRVTNVARVMKSLAEKFPGAVRTPEKRGDGYYIHVQPVN